MSTPLPILTTNVRPTLLTHAAGCLLLARISLRRTLWSRQTVISLLLLALAAIVVKAWSRHHGGTEEFCREVVLLIFVPFLLPIFCLCFASPSIAADRDDRTLVYLLATPLPRPLVYLSKVAAALGPALVWSMGSWALLCWLASGAGRSLFRPLCPAILLSTLAYVALFCLLSATMRRAILVSLLYALFLEAFLGNMPGMVKRLTVSFYEECMMLDALAKLNIDPDKIRNPALLLPVSGTTAAYVLAGATVLLLLAGVWMFSRREYA
jgi:ABC-type transport system involved in multi-copper enzyme maturation permease subunit